MTCKRKGCRREATHFDPYAEAMLCCRHVCYYCGCGGEG